MLNHNTATDPKPADGGSPAAKTVGDLVRRHRTAAGLSLADLAERLNIPAQNLSAFEKGNTSPTLRTVKKYADALGVRLIDLIPHHPADAPGHLAASAETPAPPPGFSGGWLAAILIFLLIMLGAWFFFKGKVPLIYTPAFQRVYNLYPEKHNVLRSFAAYRATVKTEADRADLERVMGVYLRTCGRAPTAVRPSDDPGWKPACQYDYNFFANWPGLLETQKKYLPEEKK